MWPQCHPPSLGLICLRVPDQMWFQEFQDVRPWRPSWIAKHNIFSNFESVCHSDASHQVSAKSNLQFWEELLFEEFQGGHFGYWNRKNLAILNLYVTLMPSIKFRLNPTYGLGVNVVWRILKWPPWRPSWISEWNDFSSSESLCRSYASHQVSAQSDLWFGRRCHLKNFKMVAVVAILDIGMEWF